LLGLAEIFFPFALSLTFAFLQALGIAIDLTGDALRNARLRHASQPKKKYAPQHAHKTVSRPPPARSWKKSKVERSENPLPSNKIDPASLLSSLLTG
jgi:hypothetical protein